MAMVRNPCRLYLCFVYVFLGTKRARVQVTPVHVNLIGSVPEDFSERKV